MERQELIDALQNVNQEKVGVFVTFVRKKSEFPTSLTKGESTDPIWLSL